MMQSLAEFQAEKNRMAREYHENLVALMKLGKLAGHSIDAIMKDGTPLPVLEFDL